MGRHSFGLSPILALALASAFWGFGTVISKEFLNSIPPILFLVAQLVPSVIALWLLFFMTGNWPKNWNGLLPILILGLLNPGISYTLSMIGLVHTTASVATLVWAAEPALIVILSGIILREQVSWILIICTIAAAAGVFLASGIADISLASSDARFGAGVIFTGVLCCAVYTIYSRKIIAEHDPLLVVALQQSAALIWMLTILPIDANMQSSRSLSTLTVAELGGAVLSGLMYYAFAYWLYLSGLRAVPASQAASFFSLIPVFGIGAAYIFLGEKLSAIQWFGAAMILIAVLVIQAYASRQSNSVTS
jgi:drug/metabolite transporter (DMT)-like permease